MKSRVLKDDRRRILDDFFFGKNPDELIENIKRIYNRRTKKKVMQYWNLLVICGRIYMIYYKIME